MTGWGEGWKWSEDPKKKWWQRPFQTEPRKEKSSEAPKIPSKAPKPRKHCIAGGERLIIHKGGTG